MHRALWKKSLADVKWLLAGGMLLLFAFHWVQVWVSSLLSLQKVQVFLSLLPKSLLELSPVPVEKLASSAGRIAVSFDHPIVVLIVSIWAIGRGSDAVSGDLERGTMEMILAQPVSRTSVLATQAAVTLGGAALLALAGWLGIFCGLSIVTLEQPVSAAVFAPASLNIFALMVFLAGLTTLVSACDRYRWRTIGAVGSFYAVETIVKIIGRMAPGWKWLIYISFLTPFEPQLLVSEPDQAWKVWISQQGGTIDLGGLGYDLILVGGGAICYLAAAVVFSRRDLPAPL